MESMEEGAMNLLQLELVAIAIMASAACSLPGVFLVLRGMALMSDAISHAILLGIVVMFMLVKQLHSPLLLVGAALAGIATVWCTEQLMRMGKIKKETAIGLVFPLFFSIGVILISTCLRNVHIDSDMVLLGDIAFAPFQRLHVGGIDIGPYALWQLSVIVLLNVGMIGIFFKELAMVTFDPEHAQVSGFSPSIMHYVIMGMASLTAVAAFDIVGAIVVVALMITPAATAFLLTDRLKEMVLLSLLFSILASIGGYGIAFRSDVSIAGSIAMMAGVIFAFVFGGQMFQIVRFTRKNG
jgi:manganese/zinc/iron transport system permease protein